MSYGKSVIIGATLAGLLAGLTHRSATPKPVAPPDNQFELTWDEMAALHKADRENLVPAPPRIWPEPAPPPAKPVVEQVAAIVPVAIRSPPVKIKPIVVRSTDWCTKHHMRRVYHDRRWWCRK